MRYKELKLCLAILQIKPAIAMGFIKKSFIYIFLI